MFDKPLVLSLYDVDDFLIPEFGGFSRPIEEIASGHVCKTKKEVLLAIVEALEEDKFRHERERMKDTLHPFKDGKSTERIVQIIESHIREDLE